jgi:hypothetical protein
MSNVVVCSAAYSNSNNVECCNVILYQKVFLKPFLNAPSLTITVKCKPVYSLQEDIFVSLYLCYSTVLKYTTI